MKINGIGNVKKEKVLSVLTVEGKKAVKEGFVAMEEVASLYKREQIKKLSKIGKFAGAFNANYDRIPVNLKDKLTPKELGELVDAFYKCYGDGKNDK